MSTAARQFPVTVDTDGGGVQVNASQVLLVADPDALRVRVFGQSGSGIVTLLDEPYTAFVEGTAPREVGGRHRFDIADGRTLYVMLEGGCGCGNPLKGFQPQGLVSNRRLT